MHLLVLSICSSISLTTEGTMERFSLNLALGVLLNLLTYVSFGLKLDNTEHFAKRPT